MKKLYLGWAPARNNPKPWTHFNVPYLMINALDFMDRNQILAPVSRTLSFQGEVFCDSGGYQAMSRGVNILPQTVMETQRQLKADLNAVLDDPINPETHIRNLKIYASAKAEEKELSFVPVIPCDLDSKYLYKMVSIWPDPPLIAVGKVVPKLFPLSDQNELLNVIRRLLEIKRIYPQSNIHVFGLGGIATAAIFFQIIDSTDSSSWIHDARFRRIRRLGGGFVRPDRPRSRATFLEHGSCDCNGCKEYGPDILDLKGSKGFQLRALHNAWILNKEMGLLNKSISAGRFYDFVHERTNKSNWHKGLLQNVYQLITEK